MNLLQVPVAGSLLRWRHLRLSFQLALLLVAAAVVLHGLFGPQIAPRNLATVLTSIHWRGLLVVGLVVAGNLFCTACPMVLARDAARRIVPPRFAWPGRWRRKWLGLALLASVLFSYELFDLWELPRATASLVVGYFAAAIVVDVLFKGASFCKHVCPIGQFNYIASTMSPTEVRARDAAVCDRCTTHDCIKGRRSRAEPLRIVRRGCELGLFVPTKVGNLDCTLCLDCVHACPHDNVAIVTRTPGVEWLSDRRRSSIGRLAQRLDIATLAVLFTFGALLNAFAMTAPAVAVERFVALQISVSSEAVILAVIFVAGLVLAPAVLLAGAAAAVRGSGADRTPLGQTAAALAFALVPLGAGIWLAHYGFHLLTGFLTVVPVTQSAAIDLFGWAALGEPVWRWSGFEAGFVYPIQLGVVILGACGSIGLAQAVSLRDYQARPHMASAPLLVVILLLAGAAVWILQQPMEMRGLASLG